MPAKIPSATRAHRQLMTCQATSQDPGNRRRRNSAIGAARPQHRNRWHLCPSGIRACHPSATIHHPRPPPERQSRHCWQQHPAAEHQHQRHAQIPIAAIGIPRFRALALLRRRQTAAHHLNTPNGVRETFTRTDSCTAVYWRVPEKKARRVMHFLLLGRALRYLQRNFCNPTPSTSAPAQIFPVCKEITTGSTQTLRLTFTKISYKDTK